ncbi:MAG: hypothetical protein NVSMB17_07230 [Candidatus Dormibacteria bacterium]
MPLDSVARRLNRPVVRGLPLWQAGTLVAYLALVLVTISRHEPWFDEAQAWLLARDANPLQLITRYAGYEGTPVLWHFLLLVPAKTHMPYITLNLLSMLIALAGVVLFLRYAPFPAWLRVVFTFSYYAAYQYSVVARSYCLLLPAMFLLAMAYGRRRERPLPYVAGLLFLANIAVHGTVIAAILALLFGVEVLRGDGAWMAGRRRVAFAWLVALGVCFGALGLMLRTPADQYFVSPGLNLNPVHARQVVIHVVKTMFAEQALVSGVVLLVSLAWFIRSRHLLLFLLPFLGLLAIFVFKYFSPWHEGIVFLLWIFVMWVSFAEREPARAHPGTRRAALVALVTTLLVQVSWTVGTVAYDLNGPYSGSQAAAAFIKARGIDRTVLYGSGFWAMALQPYFDHNIYANYHDGAPPPFWLWETRNRFGTAPAYLGVFHPDYILYGIKFKKERVVPEYHGYRLVRSFPGELYWKTGSIEAEAFVLFQREDLEPLQ